MLPPALSTSPRIKCPGLSHNDREVIPILTMFFRAAILYLVIILIVRSMGKRQIGEMQPYELVITIMIADLASTPMASSSIPLLHGLMPIAALVLLQSLLTLVTLKSDRLRSLINGRASILVRNGVVDESEMRRQAITLSELMEEARIAGAPSLSQIGIAVIEVSGDLSVYPISQQRPLTPADMRIPTAYEGLTLSLILDGRIQKTSLNTAMLDAQWLDAKLSEMGLAARDVFVCTLDTQGVLCAQKKGSSKLAFLQALSPEEVRW